MVSQRLGGDWVVSLDGFLSEEGIFFLLVFEFVVLFFFSSHFRFHNSYVVFQTMKSDSFTE